MITADEAKKLAQESVNETSINAILGNISNSIDHAARMGRYHISVSEELSKLTHAERKSAEGILGEAGFQIMNYAGYKTLHWE